MNNLTEPDNSKGVLRNELMESRVAGRVGSPVDPGVDRDKTHDYLSITAGPVVEVDL